MRVLLFECREVVSLVSVVGVIVDDRVVFEDIVLYSCRLVDEEIRSTTDKSINLVMGLAPVAVLSCILAIHERNRREVVLLVEPVVLDNDVVSVLVTQGLIVPRHRLLQHESVHHFLAARLELVGQPVLRSRRSLVRDDRVADVLDVRVVHDVEQEVALVVLGQAGEAEHEVEAIIILAESDSEIVHLFVRVDELELIERVLVVPVDLTDTRHNVRQKG